MGRRIGARSIQFEHPTAIRAWATAAGRKEASGRLGSRFDFILTDNTFGEKSWERAEQKMQQYAMELAMEKAGIYGHQLDYFLGGDLLNQIIATSYTARNIGAPYFGLYGACSSLVEGLILAACLLDGGFGKRAAVCTSSHHDAAERQLRFPTEMGVQRTLSAQWTVTGSGAYILDQDKGQWCITGAVPGRIIDRGIKNSSDMGSAMAAAAVDTISAWLEDVQDLEHLDYIITGDLGKIGYEICKEQLIERGYDIADKYFDCGMQLYHAEAQDVHAGGSGCGCSALVLGAKYLPLMAEKPYSRLLLAGTGALLSPLTVQQGETIPGIAHAVVIEYRQEGFGC